MKTIEPTIEKTNSLRYSVTKIHAEGKDTYKSTIKVRLDDECKNGHQDFSVTVDTYRKGKNGQWYEDSFGCQHEKAIKLWPEVKQFVDLHLCDYSGAPMYAEANGFFHLQEARKDPSKMEGAREYVRATAEEWATLATSEDQTIFKFHLENLGIVKRWKVEADAAIKALEELTGKQFLNDSKRSQYTPLTKEEKKEIERKINTGYYHPDQIKAREDAKEKARRNKIAQGLRECMEKEIQKEKTEYVVKMAVHNAGLDLDNFIYYNHSGEGVFNWTDGSWTKTITREQFDAFVASEHSKPMYEGIDAMMAVPVTWKFKEPK